MDKTPDHPDEGPEAEGEQAHLQETEFGTFIMSLATSALLHLGEAHDEQGQAPQRIDLPLARQTIEIIGMLRDKTRGNLTPAETHLIESVLYDLRLRFVEAHRRQKQQS